MFLLRQLFDLESSTYTYLLADQAAKSAVLIDPVKEQIERDLKQLTELELKLLYALDTHVHADHVTALGELKDRTGCKTGMALDGGASCADLRLKDGDALEAGALKIKVLTTPGHTRGCLSYLASPGWLFTGDALLIRGCGRTDFQDGNAEALYDSVWKKLFTLPDDTVVYPAHDYKGVGSSTIGEEKRWNPRLTKSKAEFVAIMHALNLPQPKKIKEAVPRNLNLGR